MRSIGFFFIQKKAGHLVEYIVPFDNLGVDHLSSGGESVVKIAKKKLIQKGSWKKIEPEIPPRKKHQRFADKKIETRGWPVKEIDPAKIFTTPPPQIINGRPLTARSPQIVRLNLQ